MTQITININTNLRLGDILAFIGIYVYSFMILAVFYNEIDRTFALFLCSLLYLLIAIIAIIHCCWRLDIEE